VKARCKSSPFSAWQNDPGKTKSARRELRAVSFVRLLFRLMINHA